MESIPWVRCASGNVYKINMNSLLLFSGIPHLDMFGAPCQIAKYQIFGYCQMSWDTYYQFYKYKDTTVFTFYRKVMNRPKILFFCYKSHPKIIWEKDTFSFGQLCPGVARTWLELKCSLFLPKKSGFWLENPIFIGPRSPGPIYVSGCL